MSRVAAGSQMKEARSLVLEDVDWGTYTRAARLGANGNAAFCA